MNSRIINKELINDLYLNSNNKTAINLVNTTNELNRKISHQELESETFSPFNSTEKNNLTN